MSCIHAPEEALPQTRDTYLPNFLPCVGQGIRSCLASEMFEGTKWSRFFPGFSGQEPVVEASDLALGVLPCKAGAIYTCYYPRSLAKFQSYALQESVHGTSSTAGSNELMEQAGMGFTPKGQMKPQSTDRYWVDYLEVRNKMRLRYLWLHKARSPHGEEVTIFAQSWHQSDSLVHQSQTEQRSSTSRARGASWSSGLLKIREIHN